MKKLFHWVLNPPTEGNKEIIILRLMAGGVFFWEGIIKFVFVNQGVGRFTKIGFPVPEFTAHMVATFEIVGGLLLLFGLLTRLTAILFFIQMIVAILSTKISLYLGTSPLAPPPVLPKVGFWAVLHESRADYAQLLTSLFLVYVGAGIWSLDHYFGRVRE
ncbi:MAG TPA: DoxX family protein [Bacteroidales bacterium]